MCSLSTVPWLVSPPVYSLKKMQMLKEPLSSQHSESHGRKVECSGLTWATKGDSLKRNLDMEIETGSQTLVWILRWSLHSWADKVELPSADST